MSNLSPNHRPITNPFADPAFVAKMQADDFILQRRRKAVKIDVVRLRDAEPPDKTEFARATPRIAYRLLVRCSILAAMNLTDCEAVELEDSFLVMREQVERGDDPLRAFQSHIDTVVAAAHMSEARDVLDTVWQELTPVVRLLTDDHWPTFLRVIAWCSAENIWDDQGQIRGNLRRLRDLRSRAHNNCLSID